jgi:hypothetical protein
LLLAGIVPEIHQRGDNLRITGITRGVDRWIRSCFIKALWQAILTDPVMQTYFSKRRGKNLKPIIIKAARNLWSRTLAVIKTAIP